MELVRQKNVATFINFPIVDADGDFVTGATGLDSESKGWSDGSDGTSFADVTSEATEIGSTGIYRLSLTAGEMNFDYVTVQIKTTSAGAKTQLILIRTIAGVPGAQATTTVAGRSIDVSTGGEVGLDWANIGSPTTAQNLSATNIDVDQVVASVTGAVGSVTGNVGGNVTGSVGTINGIEASALSGFFMTDSGRTFGDAVAGSVVKELAENVTVGTLGEDVITSTSLAANAVAEIAAGIWDEDATTHQNQGSFGQAIGDPGADTNTIYKAVVSDAAGATIGVDVVAVKAETASILVDTAEIGAAGAGLTNINLPNQTMDIVGNITGNLSGSVGSVTNPVTVGAVNAAGLADFFDTDSGTTFGSAVAGSVVKEIVDNAGGGSAPTAAEIADAVWDEATAGHTTAGTTGKALTDAGSAGDPWSTALPGSYGAGTAGKIIGDNINATVSSRATQTSVDDLPTNAELATALASADDAVLAAIAALNNLSEANIRTAIGLASANLDTQLDALPTNSELATALAGADDATLAAVAALNNLSSAQVQTAAAAALTAYDPPTRAEATSDKDEVLTAVGDVPTNAELTTALGTADDATLAQIALVKAKTDQLTFTTTGEVDSNIHSVNDVAVGGAGTELNPWGPA